MMMAATGIGLPVIGTVNPYPPSECTWYASERYHSLTGAFVPWLANACDWLQRAQAAGWQFSRFAPSGGIPSIIVLQPGVQGADSYGHVAIVERVNPDGSVYTSDLNWGMTPEQRARVSYVTFRPGAGVSFVWIAQYLNRPPTPKPPTSTPLIPFGQFPRGMHPTGSRLVWDGHTYTVVPGGGGRIWGVPGTVSRDVAQHTPIPPKLLLYAPKSYYAFPAL